MTSLVEKIKSWSPTTKIVASIATVATLMLTPLTIKYISEEYNNTKDHLIYVAATGPEGKYKADSTANVINLENLNYRINPGAVCAAYRYEHGKFNAEIDTLKNERSKQTN